MLCGSGAHRGLIHSHTFMRKRATAITTNGRPRVLLWCTPLLGENLYSRLRNHPETPARMHEDASLQVTTLVVSQYHARSTTGSSFSFVVCVSFITANEACDHGNVPVASGGQHRGHLLSAHPIYPPRGTLAEDLIKYRRIADLTRRVRTSR